MRRTIFFCLVLLWSVVAQSEVLEITGVEISVSFDNRICVSFDGDIKHITLNAETITRDGMGRITGIGNVAITRDGSGRITGVGNASITRDRSTRRKITGVGNFAITRDGMGRITGVGNASITRDGSGRIISVEGDPQVQAVITFEY